MKYTYQTLSESGSFSYPEGADVGHADFMYQLEAALDDWAYLHERVGSNKRDAILRVWIGDVLDVTDIYPDFDLYIGPRGGICKAIL